MKKRIPISKASKLTKGETIAVLRNGRFADSPEGASFSMRIFGFAEGILTTKMCFVAGTMVLAAHGSVPIEEIRPGMQVWARDEYTMAEDWKPVVDTFITHPSELFRVKVDVDGDGDPEDELVGTGEHPFWIDQASKFVPMKELRPGMTVSLANGGTAIVIGNVSERGPPDELLTTYNFEVEDFHTYFVGESGVWVHNTGKAPCERVFSIFTRLMTRHGDDLVKTYDDVLAKLPNMPTTTRASFIDDLVKQHKFLGDLKAPKAPAGGFGVNERVLIGGAEGLQSSKLGKFRGVRQGNHGDSNATYLWTMDDRGINAAWEKTPYPTPRGNIVHSNLSDEAYIGGEAWFNGNKVTINAGSGRYGDGVPATQEYWEAAVRYWEHLGYEVEAIPWGSR